MEPTSMRSGEGASNWLRDADWGSIATWLLGFVLIAYLGMEGGGYDPIVHDQVGIAAWWLALVGVAVGALPRDRLPAAAWAALGLLAAFAAWTALSLTWTESSEKTFSDLARVAGYLGIFAVALLLHARGEAHRLVGAVAAGIGVVAMVALLSRLHPAWFPEADQTAQFLTGNRERLSYPLNYWNGLGSMLAIGFPLVLHFATAARPPALRALATAALPAMVLTSFFTFSRAGIGAAAIAIVLFLLLTGDRLPKLLTTVVAAIGGAILCLAANSRDSLADGLVNAAAESQGDEILLMTVFVCVLVAALGVGIGALAREEERPDWARVEPRQAMAGAAVAAVAILIAFVALGGPGRAADAWEEFKEADSPGQGSGRLTSAAGQSRYEYWLSAIDQNETDRLKGTGSGTFEYWWTRDRDSADAIRDTHSLYFQTLGELGIVGLLLLLAFLLLVLAAGALGLLRTVDAERALLAAALAGCVAFLITAAFDWMWQLPVVAASFLILAAVLVSAPAGPDHDREGGRVAGRRGLAMPLRLGTVVVAVAAMVAISIPLATAGLLRESESEAGEGDLAGALDAARSAQNVQPGAATPRLQQALVLEELGALDQAAEAARAATERGPTNWRTWLILARVEAQRGRAVPAVEAYREARSLNPESPLFED